MDRGELYGTDNKETTYTSKKYTDCLKTSITQNQNQKARLLVVKMLSFNNSYKLEIDNIEVIHMIVESVLL